MAAKQEDVVCHFSVESLRHFVQPVGIKSVYPLERIGEEAIHISLIFLPSNQFEGTKSINCFTVTHLLSVERSSGCLLKEVTQGGLSEPMRGGSVIQAIAHLLSGEGLAAVYAFEYVKLCPFWCFGVEHVERELGVFNPLLQVELQVLEALAFERIGARNIFICMREL